jgi:hypothetical protein
VSGPLPELQKTVTDLVPPVLAPAAPSPTTSAKLPNAIVLRIFRCIGFP